MKVNGTSSIGQPAGLRQARPAGADGFRLPSASGASGAAGAAPTTGLSGVASVDALLALQDVGGPLERKRRAVGRASRLLDVLDEVKLALIDGELDAGGLDRLRRAIREERQRTDEPGLEDLLDQIETRAAVELAKLERRSAA